MSPGQHPGKLRDAGYIDGSFMPWPAFRQSAIMVSSTGFSQKTTGKIAEVALYCPHQVRALVPKSLREVTQIAQNGRSATPPRDCAGSFSHTEDYESC